jgi:hypothetical protein
MKFIGKEDLMRNKEASGRPKDRIDLEELGKLGESFRKSHDGI